jgi:hypothetical protein
MADLVITAAIVVADPSASRDIGQAGEVITAGLVCSFRVRRIFATGTTATIATIDG